MNQADLDALMNRQRTILDYIGETFPEHLATERLWEAFCASLREAVPLDAVPDWAEPLIGTTLIDWQALLFEDHERFDALYFKQRETYRFQTQFTDLDAPALAKQLRADSSLMIAARHLAELLTAANADGMTITRLDPSQFFLFDEHLGVDWDALAKTAHRDGDRLLSSYELGWMHPALRKREIPRELTPSAATTHSYAYWLLHTLTCLPPAANQASLLNQIERFRLYNPHLPGELRPWLRTWLRLPADSQQTPLDCWQTLEALVQGLANDDDHPAAQHDIGGESLFGRNKRGHQNEDSLFILDAVPGVTLLAVADGVSTATLGTGGQASFTVRELAERQRQILTVQLAALAESDTWESDGWHLIETFFENAHQAVVNKLNDLLNEALEQGTEPPATADTMSSTLILALVRGHQALIGHWGDSRAYRLSPAGAVRLTEDHNTEMEAILNSHGARYKQPEAGSSLVRVLGQCQYDAEAQRFVAVEQKISRDTCRLAADDYLLLCSDGLLGGLKGDTEIEKEQRLLQIVEQHRTRPCREIARQLARTADDDKGDDNITAVVLRVLTAAIHD